VEEVDVEEKPLFIVKEEEKIDTKLVTENQTKLFDGFPTTNLDASFDGTSFGHDFDEVTI